MTTVDSTDTVTEAIATLTLLAAPRAGMLLPALGNSSDTFGGNVDFGFEGMLTVGRSSGDLQYVMQARFGPVYATDDFAEQLGLTSTQGANTTYENASTVASRLSGQLRASSRMARWCRRLW